MIIHKHPSVTQALYRHRLSLPELAAQLEVPVRDLNRESLPEATEEALYLLAQEAPAPLTAVADLPADTEDRRERLLADAQQLTQQCLTLVGKLNKMEDLHAQQRAALNRLRLHVKGKRLHPALAHLPVGNWKMARPLEEKLENGVKANGPGARESTQTRLAEANAGLNHIRNERLPAYEATEGEFADCQALFTTYDYELSRLALDKELRRMQREQAEASAPLVLAPNGQNLSLTAQKPEAALAQELAEIAVEEAMAQQRSQERLMRQEGKALKQQLIEEAFDALLPCLEAGDRQVRPVITAEALVHAPTEDGEAPRPTPKVVIERVETPAQPVQPVQSVQPVPQALTANLPVTKAATPAPLSPAVASKEATAGQPHKPASGKEARFSAKVSTGYQPKKKKGKKGKGDKRGTGPSGERRPVDWLAHHEVIYQQQIAKNGGKAPRGRLRGEVFKSIMRLHPKPPDLGDGTG